MLTGKEKRELRSLGNHLKPELWIGKEAVSAGSIQTLNNSFNTKELVKVKILESCELEKEEVAQRLSDQTNSEIVQILGNTILLYRPLPEQGS
ncbi:MAG: ribosome assembly RNA-binding protein YhbY [Calditrichaeota bacterium]|nr:ribosome assembly RNA-binding protein YhbY [Calditrichota bacterium]RQW07053.1 MAG: ribosome assembly RNA-binding protein YhbY [Calditrichota bacterium]